MNGQNQVSNQSWLRSIANDIVIFFATWRKPNYRPIIQGLLPEVLRQHKNRKDAMDFVLRRWNGASDNEIKTISKLLKNGIFLTKNGLLIVVGTGIGLIIMGSAALYIVSKESDPQPPPPVPDCVINNNCTILLPVVFVGDQYSPNFDKGQLMVTLTANGTPDDRLSIRNQGKNQGEMGIDGGNVTYGGTVIGSFEGGDGTSPLIVNFNEKVTREVAQVLVRQITYQNISDSPTIGSRTVEIRITDGDGGISKVLSKNIRVIADDNELVLNVPGPQTIKENSDSSISGISISAPDNQKVTLTLKASQGKITVKPDVAGGVSADNINENEINNVFINGTVAQINTTLAAPDAVTYQSNTNDRLTVTVRSEDLVWPPKAEESMSDSKDISITLSSLNPPPVVTVPGSQFANENEPKAIGGIKVSDLNNQNVNVTLQVFNGTLTIKTDVLQGLSADFIDNNKTNQVTLRGSLVAINNIFSDPDGVIYRSDRSGKDILYVIVNDGSQTASDMINIAVNDNPVLIVPERVSERVPERVSEFENIPDIIPITKEQAVNRIKSWLQVKSSVFGRFYNRQRLREYTTGKYFEDSLERLNWLRRNNAYYIYRSSTAEAAGLFLVKGNQIIIDVKVGENLTYRRYVNRRLDKNESGYTSGVYRWTLQLENGNWKIADSQKLN